MVKAAILGYGTVGSGVAEVLSCNQELIAKRAGNPIEVKYILDLRNFPGDPNETKVVHDIEVILQDPEISIVCETMGGNEPAYTFSKRALKPERAYALRIRSWLQITAQSFFGWRGRIAAITFLRRA